ncbi:MAG: hypothetical protein LBJ01_05285 [Tannerella sp.]|nr:hypothetical protein [Tannerella sp.]
MSGREDSLPAANGISARQPVPARDGMLVEKETRGTPPVPARDGMWSEGPYLAQGKTGGWTQPRLVSAVPPFSFTFRPGRDGPSLTMNDER